MTTLREAAQQALEALECCVKALDALNAPGDSIYTRAFDLADWAEIALRAALAQQEEQSDINWLKARPHVEDFIDHLGYDMTITNERVRFDAREKVDVLAQQEQEPLSVEDLARALVASRVIDAAAIDDPEGYDDGVMLDQVRAAYRRLA